MLQTRSDTPPSSPGAYLVPYLVLLVIIGIPLFFLELAVGQRIRRGSIGVWHYVCPRLGGIGFSSCIVSPGPALGAGTSWPRGRSWGWGLQTRALGRVKGREGDPLHESRFQLASQGHAFPTLKVNCAA